MQLNAGLTIQIDIEDDAESATEIAMTEQSSGGFEWCRIKAVFSEQPLNASQHGSVIIYDKNRSSVPQRCVPSVRGLFGSLRPHVNGRRWPRKHIHTRQIRAVIKL